MHVSVFDLFKIGIGPSSSHTVGPMRAAYAFVADLTKQPEWDRLTGIEVTCYGSLAWTGLGHGTDHALLLGLCGELPDTVDPLMIQPHVASVKQSQKITLMKQKEIPFAFASDIIFDKKEMLPFHSNGMRFRARQQDHIFHEAIYYSVGGGFIVKEGESLAMNAKASQYDFHTASTLLMHCDQNKKSIAEIVAMNEALPEKTLNQKLDHIWSVMNDSIERGLHTSGQLPGGLGVKRRAPALYAKLKQTSPIDAMSILSTYAIAVNEENAAGGRVVTAPTNGAAGIIPATIRYYLESVPNASQQGVRDFLLTAAAMGALYQKGASISAAEVGCQGEVGVACSMAAAGLVAAQGGTIWQVEHAAEMGMEHHLGLTCDPIGGLVQIPCIERNAMGAVQAVTSARLALLEKGEHKVTLDQVIVTMRNTGRDMSTKYKETSQGGLALSAPEC